MTILVEVGIDHQSKERSGLNQAAVLTVSKKNTRKRLKYPSREDYPVDFDGVSSMF